jgi:DNA-binding Lrp family transcriptional regulator
MSDSEKSDSNGSDATSGSTRTHRWTFLTNHAHVLIALNANPDMILREVAAQVGITERGVQRIVQELEEEGFIRREKVGRKNRYEVLADQALRHPLESHRKIGDLLTLIAKT